MHFQESKWINIDYLLTTGGRLAVLSLPTMQSPAFEILRHLRSHLAQNKNKGDTCNTFNNEDAFFNKEAILLPNTEEVVGSDLIPTIWKRTWAFHLCSARPEPYGCIWYTAVGGPRLLVTAGGKTHNQGTASSWSFPDHHTGSTFLLERGQRRQACGDDKGWSAYLSVRCYVGNS